MGKFKTQGLPSLLVLSALSWFLFAPSVAASPASLQKQMSSVESSSQILSKELKSTRSSSSARQNASRWRKIHQDHMNAQKRGLSFDLIEVLSSSSPVPSLPLDLIRSDPKATVSRLSVAQRVDLSSQEQWAVVADLQEGYLLELQKKIDLEAFVYRIQNKELIRVAVPVSESVQKVSEILSSENDLWALSVAHPDYVDVLAWDSLGRPEVAREKKQSAHGASIHGALVYFSYKDHENHPSWAQLIQVDEQGKTKHTTVLFLRVDPGLSTAAWSVEDVVQDAVQVMMK